MRFLCLHGKGSNSRILEKQLSTVLFCLKWNPPSYSSDLILLVGAVQYQLGNGHQFEFVEGTVEDKPALGVHRESIQDTRVADFDQRFRALFRLQRNVLVILKKNHLDRSWTP
jgi:hypothetical protein